VTSEGSGVRAKSGMGGSVRLEINVA